MMRLLRPPGCGLAKTRLIAVVKRVTYLAPAMSEISHLELGRPARPGQLILKRRFQLTRRLLPDLDSLGRMLDLGCGNGAQSLYFRPHVGRLIGLDVVPMTKDQPAVRDGEFDFVRGDGGRLPFKTGTFDLVTAFEVLEHLSDDQAAVTEVARVLRPGGRLLFSVPNKWWLFESHGASVPGWGWVPWNRVPFVSWLPRLLHERIARARIYTIARALRLARRAALKPLQSGYITAPLDVLPSGALRDGLRATIFRSDATSIPFLAVNLYVLCRKPRRI